MRHHVINLLFSAVIVLATSFSAPNAAAALPDFTAVNNQGPGLCQSAAGGTWSVAYITLLADGAPVTPVGNAIKLGAEVTAYLSNLTLKYCAPDITAPATVKVEPDPGSCNHIFNQPTTDGDFSNFLGVPYGFSGPNWGDLGRPRVYDYNTDVDAYLVDPTTDAAWTTGSIALPVGRNVLTWRAESKMSVMDVIPLFVIPYLVPGDGKAEQAVLEKSPPLAEFVTSEFESIPKSTSSGGVASLVAKLIPKTVEGTLDDLDSETVHHILDLPPWATFDTGTFTGYSKAVNEDSQEVWVYDTVPPTLQTNTNTNTFPTALQQLITYDATTGTYYLEAYAPSIPDVSIDEYASELLTAHDDCQGTRPPLVPTLISESPSRSDWAPGDTGTLQWQVADDGPNLQGGSNLSNVVEQKFEVRVTHPPTLIAPPSVAVVIPTTDTSASVQLGSPQVYEVADYAPDVSNNVNDNPSAFVSFKPGINTVTWTATDPWGNTTTEQQLIIVEYAGTNTPPIGYDQTVSAVSEKPIDIILKGYDANTDPNTGRHFPLTFTITNYPSNGFFVAPLLPYFIDDYRLDAEAVRFAGQPEQADPAQYCTDLQNGSVSGPTHFQMGYPYFPDGNPNYYFSVDDDGTAIVYDQGDIQCQFGAISSTPRLAEFAANGDLLHYVDVDSTLTDVYVDRHTKIVYTVDAPDPGSPDVVSYYDKDLKFLGNRNLEYQNSDGTDIQIKGPAFITSDTRGIIYVGARGTGVNPVVAIQGPVSVDDLGSNTLGQILGVVDIGTNMYEIATDSGNNVYISEPDRILKFATSTIDANGRLVPGAFIGWMGRCDSNLTSTNACDTVNHHSVVYSCTDALCGTSGSNYGTEPGQFNDAKGIAIDPNDILYVCDYGNSRVQRFTPEGDFAGQAISNGVGYGFIIGDFGQPENITVNSNHFYILNNNLLNVLQTTPITPIDDSSAKVTYQSNNNFVGADSFTFADTDGLATGTGTVTVNVARNYRPPVISAPPSYNFNEGSSVNITLVGSDPDGSLDVLSYIVVDEPAHGTLSGSGANLVYTPDQYYYGTDSFTYEVSNGVNQSAPAAVELTVAPIEHVPQVTTSTTDDENLGYNFQFPIDVFDPDANPTLMVSVDWGDGSQLDHGGVVTDKDGNVVTGNYIQPDGSLPSGLKATGPVLTLDSGGNGTVSFEHAFSVLGHHVAQICVTDHAQILPNGTKQATSASHTGCAQTTFNVTLSPDLVMMITPDTPNVDPGTADYFTTTITDAPFDVTVPGYAKGLDVTNVIVDVTAGSDITMTDFASSQGACAIVQGSMKCNLGNLSFGRSATIKVETAIDSLAPGGASLTLSAGRQADGVPALENAAVGTIQVTASGKPPVAQSLNPVFGPTAGGTIVTLTGQNFDAGANVLFDNIPATNIDVVNADTINLTTPAHIKGSVDVVVVNSDNQSAQLPQYFQYTDSVSVGGGFDVISIILLAMFSLIFILKRRRISRV